MTHLHSTANGSTPINGGHGGSRCAEDVENTDTDDLMEVFADHLVHFLVQETGCSADNALKCLQWPNDLGDIVAVLPRLKLEGVDAATLAEDLAEKFPESRMFAQPFADNFNLRFMFLEEALTEQLIPFILRKGACYGMRHRRTTNHAGLASGKVIIEYSSPNIGQQFDGNHLRSTITGHFLAGLYEMMGWQVVRLNFLGDWGKHIGLLAAAWTRFGSDEELRDNPLRHLQSIVAKTESLRSAENLKGSTSPHQIDCEKDIFFKALEEGDVEALLSWKRFRDASVGAYKTLYSTLNTTFDVYSGESEVSVDSIGQVEEALKNAGVYRFSKGAWIIEFPAETFPGLGIGIGRYKNGTTTYLLRDIAATLDREKHFSFDKMLYVVSTRQDAHFRQVFGALKLMGCGELAHKLEHIGFGPVNGMSSVGGCCGASPLDGVRHECMDSTSNDHTTNSQTSVTEPGCGSCFHEGCRNEGVALAVQVLAAKRASAVPLEPSGVVSSRGKSGQTLCDCVKALSKAIDLQAGRETSTAERDIEAENFLSEGTTAVLRHAILFPGVVQSSFKSLESSGLMVFLSKLVAMIDEVQASATVCGADGNGAHVDFLKAVKQVLVNGMRILGFPSGFAGSGDQS